MKNFKSLIAFRHAIPDLVEAVELQKIPALRALQNVLACWPVQDPEHSEWSRIGFLANPAGDMYYANESGLILYVSIRERILPGPVLRAEVNKRAIKLAERQGRACNRKELAQLREDAEAYLLPRSHVKETLVPVILRQKWIFVCTSSAKRADEVVLLMMRALASQAISRVETVSSPVAWMNELATGVGTDAATDTFYPGEAISVQGEDADKGTISFKGEDVSSDRVGDLIESQGYNAIKMQVQTDSMSFTMTKALIVSGIKFKDIIVEQLKDIPDADDPESQGRAEFDSTLAIVAQEFHELMKNLVTSLGGIKEVPVVTDDEPQQSDDDDTGEEVVVKSARGLKFWMNEETSNVFYTRNDVLDPDGENVVEINENQYELEGGEPIAEADLLWLDGEDDEPSEEQPPINQGKPVHEYDDDDEEL